MDNVTRQRVEAIMGQLEGGEAITYSSGLAAVTALIHAIKPRRLFVAAGYFGVNAAFKQWKDRQLGGADTVTFLTEEEVQVLYLKSATTATRHIPAPWNTPTTENGNKGTETSHVNGDAQPEADSNATSTQRELDLIWVESPNNPYGTIAGET